MFQGGSGVPTSRLFAWHNWLLICWLQFTDWISSSEEKEVDLSLTDWLDGIQKTVQSSIQQHIDRESQGKGVAAVMVMVVVVVRFAHS